MARIRTVKPEFHTDGTSGQLSDTAKVLFLGILNHSDDVGVVEDSLPELHAKIFPYKQSRAATKRAWVELLESRMLQGFTMGNGRAYLYINNFLKHQRIDRPSAGIVPGWDPGETMEAFVARTEQPDLFSEPSARAQRGLDELEKKKKREKHGRRVLLYPGEHEALTAYLGGDVLVLEAYIEALDDYMDSKGKTYQDHAATIRSWYRKDKAEGKVRAKGSGKYT